MINGIGQLGKVLPKYHIHAKRSALKPLKSDCFVKTAKTKAKEGVLQKAKEKIIQEIKDNDIEYGFIIGKNGEILAQCKGNKKSCSFDSRKIAPGSKLLHGHPKALPLSSADIAMLISTPAGSQEAIMRDGRFSRMIKEIPNDGIGEYQKLYCDLEKELNVMALDKLKIDYKPNLDDAAQVGKDYLANVVMLPNAQEMSNDNVLEFLANFGINTKDEPEKIIQKLKEMMFFQLLSNPNKYDKIHNCIIENNDAIQKLLNSEEGAFLRHEFAKKIAEKYNLKYETNLF